MRMIVRSLRWMVRIRMRIASRCFEEGEREGWWQKAGAALLAFPFPPTENFGTKDTFVALPIPQLIFH